MNVQYFVQFVKKRLVRLLFWYLLLYQLQLFHFSQKPKNLYTNLVAVTIKHPEEYLEMDNVIYTWLNRMVTRRIPFIDVVEANIELTVISPAQFTQALVKAYSPWISH